jgi:hypothetical protein
MNSIPKQKEIVESLKANKKTSIPVVSLGMISIVSTWLYFSPYLIVQGIQKAASEENTEELSKHINSDALKESARGFLQTQVQKEMEKQIRSGNPFALGGMAAAQPMIESLTNILVSPQTIGAIFEGKIPADFQQLKGNETQTQQSLSVQNSRSKPEISMRYESFNTFVVQIKNKNDQSISGFVFKRNGLDWKLSEMRYQESANL